MSGPNIYTVVTVSKAGVINFNAVHRHEEYRCVSPMLQEGS